MSFLCSGESGERGSDDGSDRGYADEDEDDREDEDSIRDEGSDEASTRSEQQRRPAQNIMSFEDLASVAVSAARLKASPFVSAPKRFGTRTTLESILRKGSCLRFGVTLKSSVTKLPGTTLYASFESSLDRV